MGLGAEAWGVLPMVTDFQARHGLADFVIVADAGMLSASNLLEEAGLRFIVGSRLTKALVDVASHFRWRGDAFTDGQIIDTNTPSVATRKAAAVNETTKRAEPVRDPNVRTGSWRAVWAYLSGSSDLSVGS